MCILFVFVASKDGSSNYRLVLASNRDEDFSRPSRSAHFWDDKEEVIAGMDMTPGKERGTWLGATLTGKLAVLLNYSAAPSSAGKKGRGYLVNDYLSTHLHTTEFLTHLKQDATLYNPYHLITLDLCETGWPLHHFTNINPKISLLPTDCYAFSNGALDRPYRKAKVGREKFRSLVQNLGQSSDTKDALINGLLELLRDKERHYPDAVLDELPLSDPTARESLSSIFVEPSKGTFGTRTSTVILVDTKGVVDFIEWTLEFPIVDGEKKWLKTHEQFNLNLA